MTGKARDIKGERFGRLVAVARVGTASNGSAIWHCECACGGFAKVQACSLKNGNTRSCGCYRSEAASLRNRRKWRTSERDIYSGSSR